MNLLHIIGSPRGDQSRTLSISNTFLQSLQAKNPGLQVKELDLFKADLPEVFDYAAKAKYTVLGGATPDGQEKEVWNKIVAYANEFLAADMYLISCPMWNFSIPYRLKQYIDIIVQPGLLFQFTENGVEGLVKGKKMICITSRGSDFGPDSPFNPYDLLDPYIKAIFGFVGIYDISFVTAQPLDYNPELATHALDQAKLDAQALAQSV